MWADSLTAAPKIFAAASANYHETDLWNPGVVFPPTYKGQASGLPLAVNASNIRASATCDPELWPFREDRPIEIFDLLNLQGGVSAGLGVVPSRGPGLLAKGTLSNYWLPSRRRGAVRNCFYCINRRSITLVLLFP
jgi:hypothetical protein